MSDPVATPIAPIVDPPESSPVAPLEAPPETPEEAPFLGSHHELPAKPSSFELRLIELEGAVQDVVDFLHWQAPGIPQLPGTPRFAQGA